MSETKVTVKADSHSARKMMLIRLAVCAILTSMAVILMYFEFPLPFMPPFLKFDFSELPVLFGTFALGPLWGIVIELLKNLIHLPATGTMGIGEFSNFITGSIFVGTAGLVYRKMRTRPGVALSVVVGTIALAIIAVPVNAFITLPLYASAMGFSTEAIIGMCTSVNPLVKDKLSLLLAVFVPFNLIKGFGVGLWAFLIYLPLKNFVNKIYDKTHKKAEK
ncbi:riboflavin transporter FmnP [Ruminococcaceae bacterium R-25]|jgi:riboflavin transporter FmnP|nr:riboflavin transporter FmnP [Ruminococcaceae bacterium R-25]SUQ22274.1 Riboflavin transporter FmnP [Oscillospiraceae bacterium]